VRLHDLHFRKRIVIQRNTVDNRKPAENDFCVFCPTPPESDWHRMFEMITRKSRGRIALRAEVTSGGEPVGTFEGVYVVLRQA
jgi:thioesterase domain-containing protein